MKSTKDFYEEKLERYNYIINYFKENPRRVKSNKNQLYELARVIGWTGLQDKELKVTCHSLEQNLLKLIEENIPKKEDFPILK